MYLTTYKQNNIIQFKSSKTQLNLENAEIIEQIYVPFYKEILVNFMFRWLSFWEHKIYKSSAYDCVENDTPNGYSCEPSGDKYLDKVLKWCYVQECDKILDVGCGLGASAIKMMKYNFEFIMGVDNNKEIVEKARENIIKHFNTLNQWRRYAVTEDYIEFLPSCVLLYYNYFYLFNPFNSVIMEKFIDKVIKSYKSNPRKIRIIYRNPICDELFIDAGFEVAYEIKDFIGVGIKVYEYE